MKDIFDVIYPITPLIDLPCTIGDVPVPCSEGDRRRVAGSLYW